MRTSSWHAVVIVVATAAACAAFLANLPVVGVANVAVVISNAVMWRRTHAPAPAEEGK